MMANSLSMKNKPIGKILSAATALLLLVTLVVYLVYTTGMHTANTTTICCGVLAILFNLVYFGIDKQMPIDVIALLEIAAAALTAECFVTFLRDSLNNLADLLNGITLFSGGTGSVPMIFGLLGAFLVLCILQIVICFMRDSK